MATNQSISLLLVTCLLASALAVPPPPSRGQELKSKRNALRANLFTTDETITLSPEETRQQLAALLAAYDDSERGFMVDWKGNRRLVSDLLELSAKRERNCYAATHKDLEMLERKFSNYDNIHKFLEESRKELVDFCRSLANRKSAVVVE